MRQAFATLQNGLDVVVVPARFVISDKNLQTNDQNDCDLHLFASSLVSDIDIQVSLCTIEQCLVRSTVVPTELAEAVT